jgi:ubiquinone/menaquinone biosynthesis C-methylase UbiE
MGAKQVYDRIAKKYHEIAGSHFFNAYLEVPATTAVVGNVRGKKVLDLGCGTGRHAAVLKRKGARVWGIDISPKMVGIARSEVKGVEFRVGDACRLPYKPNSFDVVVAGLVVEHFRDLGKAFRQVRRVLKPKGTFIFSLGTPLWRVSKPVKGRPGHRVFGDYFKEGKILSKWPTFKTVMPNYHRTMTTIVKALVKNGFVVAGFLDAKPVPAAKKRFPKLYRTFSRIPYFCVIKARKV